MWSSCEVCDAAFLPIVRSLSQRPRISVPFLRESLAGRYPRRGHELSLLGQRKNIQPLVWGASRVFRFVCPLRWSSAFRLFRPTNMLKHELQLSAFAKRKTLGDASLSARSW